MSIESLPANIYTTLSTHAGLIALVSTRIYPITTEYQGTAPFVVYNQVSEQQFNILENTGGGGKRKVLMRFESYAASHLAAFNVAEQVRLAMRDATLYKSSYQFSIDRYEDEVKLYSVISEYSVMTT